VDEGEKRCNNVQNSEDLETAGRGFAEDEETKLGKVFIMYNTSTVIK